MLGGIGSVKPPASGARRLYSRLYRGGVAVASFPSWRLQRRLCLYVLILVLLFRPVTIMVMNVWKGAVSDAQRYDYRRQ